MTVALFDPCESPPELRRVSHRQPERRAWPSDLEVGDREQRLSIDRRAPHLVDAEIVARPLAQRGACAAQQPDQNVRPVKGVHDPRAQIPRIVAPPHVRQFVQQHRVAVLTRALADQ